VDRHIFEDRSKAGDGDIVLPAAENATLPLLEELRALYACLNGSTPPPPDSLAKAHGFVRNARLALGGAEPSTLTSRRSPGLRNGGLADWQLKAVSALVTRDLEERPSVTQLAAAVRLSVSHFSRTFRLTCGMSPMEYITTMRVEAARTLLMHDELSLREIALRCGFADQSHFSRVFRTITGYPPKQWRLEHGLTARKP